MTTAVTIASGLLRALGVVQLVLGLLFWTGNALGLVNVHIVLGLTLVLTLWILAGLAARARVSAGLVVLAVTWGVLTPVLGLTQTRLLPGGAHWVVQVVHLLVGLGAIGIGESLAARTHAGERVPVG